MVYFPVWERAGWRAASRSAPAPESGVFKIVLSENQQLFSPSYLGAVESISPKLLLGRCIRARTFLAVPGRLKGSPNMFQVEKMCKFSLLLSFVFCACPSWWSCRTAPWSSWRRASPPRPTTTGRSCCRWLRSLRSILYALLNTEDYFTHFLTSLLSSPSSHLASIFRHCFFVFWDVRA